VERLTLPEIDRFYAIEERRGIVTGIGDSNPASDTGRSLSAPTK
jgi:hypothetical protein